MDDAIQGASSVHLFNAGTGSGKTLAYLLGSHSIIPHKKVVICTGTVALQEQIMKKDLPAFREGIQSDITAMIAKGRGRYLCQKQLMDKFDGFQSDSDARRQAGAMIESIDLGQWDGDLDKYADDVKQEVKRSCGADGVQCRPSKCPFAANCGFAKDRQKLAQADIIVTNYNLLLNDLEKEREHRLLPEIKKAVWIFDEADKLPEIIKNHYEGRFEPSRILFYLKKGYKAIQRSTLPRPAKPNLLAQCSDLIDTFKTIEDYFNCSFTNVDKSKGYRYPKGRVSQQMLAVIERVRVNTEKVIAWANAVRETEKEALESNVRVKLSSRPVFEIETESQKALLLCEGFESNYDTSPHAKYVCYKQAWGLESYPLDYPNAFQSQFWDKAQETHCFLTSATLKIAGSFNHFIKYSGLSHVPHKCHDIKSHFHYPSMMTFEKVEGIASPKERDKFIHDLATRMPEMVQGKRSSLVLFTSKYVMHQVYERLQGDLKAGVLLQGSCGFKSLINRHKAQCDKGQPSIIFGLKSCAIGLDLPKQYCENVIITKIDFPVPSGFFDEAFNEYIVYQGGSPFYEHAIPEAMKTLIQSIGRLIRTEDDKGVVQFCDQRLWTTKYGQQMARHLPKGAWA